MSDNEEPIEEEPQVDEPPSGPNPRFTVDMDMADVIPGVRKDFGMGYRSGPTVVFSTVPRDGSKDMERPWWRILLTPDEAQHPPFGLVIRADAIIGRGEEVDLDLTPYLPDEPGVSRRHALLRPRPTNLFLIDLESRNGTFVNGSPVGPGMATPLKNDDAIAFGNVHFTVNVISRPQPDEAGGSA